MEVCDQGSITADYYHVIFSLGAANGATYVNDTICSGIGFDVH